MPRLLGKSIDDLLAHRFNVILEKDKTVKSNAKVLSIFGVDNHRTTRVKGWNKCFATSNN